MHGYPVPARSLDACMRLRPNPQPVPYRIGPRGMFAQPHPGRRLRDHRHQNVLPVAYPPMVL
jgi:hypothetical protein